MSKRMVMTAAALLSVLVLVVVTVGVTLAVRGADQAPAAGGQATMPMMSGES